MVMPLSAHESLHHFLLNFYTAPVATGASQIVQTLGWLAAHPFYLPHLLSEGGASGRYWTNSLFITSELLYHWATEA